MASGTIARHIQSCAHSASPSLFWRGCTHEIRHSYVNFRRSVSQVPSIPSMVLRAYSAVLTNSRTTYRTHRIRNSD